MGKVARADLRARWQRTYTYGRQRISQNQRINSTWSPSFYGYDGPGSVRKLTDTTGTVTDTYDYDAWGNAINTTGNTPNTYFYGGEQYDTDLRLYYLRARYFNSLSGRFLTKDSVKGTTSDPHTLHKYPYASSDPVNGKDPTGKSSFCEYTINIASDPHTLHKYPYASSDPVNGKDPTGKSSFCEYTINIGNRAFNIAVHHAHEAWTVPFIGRIWCIHIQLLTYAIGGLSGNQLRYQIPLPWYYGMRQPG